MNWTVFDLGKVMLINKFEFALKPDNKHLRVLKEQRTSNRLENIKHSPVEALWFGRGFHWDIAPTCISKGDVLCHLYSVEMMS